MCKASFLYSMELSESVRVPQPSRLTEKLSSRITFAVLFIAVVALGGGTFVTGRTIEVAVSKGSAVSVAAWLRKGILRQFALRIPIAATEKTRQVPARQPMIQPVGSLDLGVACFTRAGLR